MSHDSDEDSPPLTSSMITQEEADSRLYGFTSPGPDTDDPTPADLTPEQRERATAALKAVGVHRDDQGSASHALDVLHAADSSIQWVPGPRTADIYQWQEAAGDEKGEAGESVSRWVHLADVDGVQWGNYDRLVSARVRSTLLLLLAGRFDLDYRHRHSDEPTIRYYDVNGDLYVGGDGTHRTIALKATGIERVRASIVRYIVPSEEYQKWRARRDRGKLSTRNRLDNPIKRYNPDETDQAPWPDGREPFRERVDSNDDTADNDTGGGLLDRLVALLR